jgi:hypothetical protein
MVFRRAAAISPYEPVRTTMPADETSPLLPEDAGNHAPPRLYTSTDVDRGVNESRENAHAEEGSQDTKPARNIAAIVSAEVLSGSPRRVRRRLCGERHHVSRIRIFFFHVSKLTY